MFNSLPILKLMTGSIPGYKADTTTTYVFKLLQNEQRIDLSSALSVINFLIVLVVVAPLPVDREAHEGGLVTAPAPA